MQQPKQIGILLIATKKYKQFVNQLVESLEKNFLPGHNLNLYLFTDNPNYDFPQNTDRINIKIIRISSYGFPEATLMRYHIFTSEKYSECDYLFYLDVDMRIEQRVGDEILRDLVAVYHPGFYRGGGSWEYDERSTAFMDTKERVSYYAGGFQGGSKKIYYSAMIKMRDNINSDKEKGVMARWHDESHWNKFVSDYSGDLIELSPSYCMVEEKDLRELWNINNFPAKIVALQKDHKEIRK